MKNSDNKENYFIKYYNDLKGIAESKKKLHEKKRRIQARLKSSDENSLYELFIFLIGTFADSKNESDGIILDGVINYDYSMMSVHHIFNIVLAIEKTNIIIMLKFYEENKKKINVNILNHLKKEILYKFKNNNLVKFSESDKSYIVSKIFNICNICNDGRQLDDIFCGEWKHYLSIDCRDDFIVKRLCQGDVRYIDELSGSILISDKNVEAIKDIIQNNERLPTIEVGYIAKLFEKIGLNNAIDLLSVQKENNNVVEAFLTCFNINHEVAELSILLNNKSFPEFDHKIDRLINSDLLRENERFVISELLSTHLEKESVKRAIEMNYLLFDDALITKYVQMMMKVDLMRAYDFLYNNEISTKLLDRISYNINQVELNVFIGIYFSEKNINRIQPDTLYRLAFMSNDFYSRLIDLMPNKEMSDVNNINRMSQLVCIEVIKNNFIINQNMSNYLTKMPTQYVTNEAASYLISECFKKNDLSEVNKMCNGLGINKKFVPIINSILQKNTESIIDNIEEIDDIEVNSRDAKVVFKILKDAQIKDERKMFSLLRDKEKAKGKEKKYKSKEMIYGPSNKNLSTRGLEVLVDIMSSNANIADFKCKEGRLTVSLHGYNFDLSQIIDKANLSHLHIREEISCPNYQLSSNAIEKYKKYILSSRNMAEPHLVLSKYEFNAIYHYTDVGYKNINDLLYGKIQNDVDSHKLENTFLNVVFLASGINKIQNKITPEKTVKFRRGDKHISNYDLNKLIEYSSQEGYDLFEKEGVMSISSSRKVAQSFSKNESGRSVEFVFDNVNPKNIEQYSANPDEKEFIQLPTMLQWHGYQETDSHFTFNVSAVEPLLPDKEKYSESEILFMMHLNEMPEAKNISEENKVVLNQFPLNMTLYNALNYVYENYLSKPYTDINDSLKTNFGIVPRYNHGLPHTVRRMMLIPAVAQALGLSFEDNKQAIEELQLISIFYVTERQSEVSRSENAYLYDSYREKSASNMKKYVKNSQLSISEEQLNKYFDYISCSGKINDIYDKVLDIAHCLDAMRCLDSNAMKAIFDGYISYNYISVDNLKKLIGYASNLILATGDSILSKEICLKYGAITPDTVVVRDEALFFNCSTSLNQCLEAVLNVRKPLFNNGKSNYLNKL